MSDTRVGFPPSNPPADSAPGSRADLSAARLDVRATSLGSLPLDALPESVRSVMAPAATAAEAEARTRALVHGHYENFSVISLLLPRHLRQDFCNIYAFCRTADDLGDEVGSTSADRSHALALLATFKQQTHDCFDSLLPPRPRHGGEGRGEGAPAPIAPMPFGQPPAIFLALSQTIRRHDIPIDPFLALISAFEQDQRITRYESFDQVLDYCRRSADPVGRLVLYLCGYRDPARQALSDKTCTALQLINFWQDVRRDLLERDRIYLPLDSMQRFGVSEQDLRRQIADRRCDDNFRGLIAFEVDRTEAMFDDGEALLPLLRPAVRRQIRLFSKGGRAILAAVRRRNYDTITTRPSLSRLQKGRLILTTLAGSVAGAVGSPLARLASRRRPEEPGVRA